MAQEAASTHVGAICMDTRPSLVLLEAFQHASFICRRKFGKVSPLYVNDVPAIEYYIFKNALHASARSKIQFHCLYNGLATALLLWGFKGQVMSSTFSNTCRFRSGEEGKSTAVGETLKVGPGEKPPPVHASLISGTSLLSDNERTVK
eukprot:5434202-Amphidinium_carterae.1